MQKLRCAARRDAYAEYTQLVCAQLDCHRLAKGTYAKKASQSAYAQRQVTAAVCI